MNNFIEFLVSQRLRILVAVVIGNRLQSKRDPHGTSKPGPRLSTRKKGTEVDYAKVLKSCEVIVLQKEWDHTGKAIPRHFC